MLSGMILNSCSVLILSLPLLYFFDLKKRIWYVESTLQICIFYLDIFYMLFRVDEDRI